MTKKLTQKLEELCIAYIEIGEKVAAYRKVYKPKSTNANSIKSTAFSMFAKPHVMARIAELQAPAAKRAGITLESHLDELARLRNKADEDADYGAAIRAEVARGKAAGLYVEKIDLNMTGALAERLSRAKGRK